MEKCSSPLVSVIIPIYNNASYLPGCVESILCQTYTNIEIILVDDGSKAGSGKICDEFLIDSRVKVIHQTNTGVVAARANGVRNSLGEFIFFVDSDDRLAEDMIELMLKEMDDDVDVVVFESKSSETLNASDYCKRILSFQLLPVWGKLYRNTLFNEYVFDIPRFFTVGEDFLTQLKIIANIQNKVKLCPINKYLYTPDNPNSIQRLTVKTYEYEKRMMLYFDEIIRGGYAKPLCNNVLETYFRWRLSYLGGMIGLGYPVEFELNIIDSIICDSKKYKLSLHDKVIIGAKSNKVFRCLLILEKRTKRILRFSINKIRSITRV